MKLRDVNQSLDTLQEVLSTCAIPKDLHDELFSVTLALLTEKKVLTRRAKRMKKFNETFTR